MRKFLLILGLLFLLANAVIAQNEDDVPAPQLLYRNANHLILVDGYTGETNELPFTISDTDQFSWSPDGQYLLALINRDEMTFTYCLNLYHVDSETWIAEDAIACSVQYAIFSIDSNQVIYSTIEENNAALWAYTLADNSIRDLYWTVGGEENREARISSLEWSPTGQYLTFERHKWIMGGTLNSMVVLNIENDTYFTVVAPNDYYAWYYPIWSEDDSWFLISLKEEYVVSGTMPRTNHEGDVYLVNAVTGEQYRLTYTPAIAEQGIHWTEEGEIAFTEIIEQDIILTIEEATEIEPVPREDRIYPEEFDSEDYYDPLQGVRVSPDPNLGLWVTSTMGHANERFYELNIGSIFPTPRTISFSILIDDPDQIIGWRPSDYPYAMG